jgi:hypothetical protein
MTELLRSSRMPARCLAGPWQSPHWERKMGSTSRAKSTLDGVAVWAVEMPVRMAKQRERDAILERATVGLRWILYGDAFKPPEGG